jgi:hypothetical protein
MHHKVRIPAAFLLTVILLVANVAYEWPYSVRFRYPSLNGWAAALLALSIPFSIAFLGRAFVRRIARDFTLFAAVVLLIPALLFSVLAVLDAESDELQDSLVIGLTTYRAYMRNPLSAVSQPSTMVRKELDTWFGIKLVHTIWSDSRYGNAILRSVNDSTLEIEIDGDFFRQRIEI